MKKLLMTLGILGVATGTTVAVTSCDIGKDDSSSQKADISKQKHNQETLQGKQPTPNILYSQTRDALIQRAKILNEKNHVGYVYLLGRDGTIIGEFAIKGKVVGLNQYLTPVNEIVHCHSREDACPSKELAEVDGTYGENDDGIFFFTTTGQYVEWKGQYLYVNTPFTLREKGKFHYA